MNFARSASCCAIYRRTVASIKKYQFAVGPRVCERLLITDLLLLDGGGELLSKRHVGLWREGDVIMSQ